MEKTFKVKKFNQLDTIEKEWRETLNTNTINHAVEITRTFDKLVIKTDDGSILTFKFE